MTSNPTETDKLLADVSASTAVDFGTTAPFQLGAFSLRRVGFADIPVAELIVYAAQRQSVVPVARQFVFREFKLAGLDPAETLRITPTVNCSSRRRRFVDCNEHSPTKGRNKMGYELKFHFEITPAGLRQTTWAEGRGRLPEARRDGR